tara:strand:+ start:905 stop:1540 length:636 start_codon:yes stop_codon:yes gene_type:complete
MYTSLVVSARLRASTPESVIETIKGLASAEIDARDVLGDSVYRQPLGGSSACFPEPVTDVSQSGFTHEKEWSVCLVSNLKNYNGEISAFIDWLRPHVESGHGASDWWAIVTYEEGEPEFHRLTARAGKGVIAELEAEEAASTVKPSLNDIDPGVIADGARVTIASGDGWSAELKGEWETVSFDLKDGTTKTGWVRTMPTPEKPAGKYEGEY